VDPLPDTTVALGQTLTVTAAAQDSVEGRRITYGLRPGAPAGARIDPETGVFSWTPTEGGTFIVTVEAADDGSPPLLDTRSFTVRVTPALPTVTVGDAGGVYSGSGFAATASVTGVGGVIVASDGPSPIDAAALTYTYYRIADGQIEPGSVSDRATVNAGTYGVVAHYGGSVSYLPADSALVAFTIARATPLVSVTGGEFAYDGQAHDATGSVTGVNGEALGTPTLSCKDAGGQAVSHPVNLGTYAVTASYAGSANYVPASATATLTIANTAPVFSGLSSPTITLGTASVTLSGRLAAGDHVPVGAVVSVTVKGLSAQAATVRADGSFAATFTTRSLAAGAYAIAFSYAGGGSWKAATGAGTLSVTYGAVLIGPAVRGLPHGTQGPLLIRLTDAGGHNVGSAATAVTAVGIAPASNPTAIQPPTPAPTMPSARLLFVSGSYEYLLSTRMTPGWYLFYFRVQGDPLLHSVLFQLT
jgi:hypothetical protein